MVLMVIKYNSSFLPFGAGFSICKATQEMCLKYYYLGTSEELKQRIWGRGLSQEGPIGSCSVTIVDKEVGFFCLR